MLELSGLVAHPDGALIPGRVRFSALIDSVEAAPAHSSDYILPGLIDLQINGSHGIDVMRASPGGLLDLSAHLAHEGTVAWMPTAITAAIDQIETIDRAVEQLLAEQASRHDSIAAVLGLHLEGPFISARRLGVHPALNQAPRGEELDRILALRALRLITIAPELDGALRAIAALRERGVLISIGHTDAGLDEARRGIAAGARMFTHLFNAMRPLHHRDPGVIAAALEPSAAAAAVIADGIHVDPEILRLVYRLRGAHSMVLTTDKTAAAGVGSGPQFAIGAREAAPSAGAARLADGTLAGSLISMLDGVRLMVERVGATVGEAALMAATNPALLLGLRDRGKIARGSRADLIVLGPDMALKAVFISGREII